MEPLIGWSIGKFPLNLKFIVHLEYFDGELLSLYQNSEDDFYLYSWCDIDDICHRWLVFRVTSRMLQEYIDRTISLRDLILNPVDGFLYVLDIDRARLVKNTYLVQPENLPELYIPDPESYYSFSELNRETQEVDRRLIQQKVYGYNLSVS
ncbi:MAG: hypothetical protein HC849_03775 [Oscillatoriales cyanobacterium RU_3_3]|nr:hypothetical protein [Oscillatoriales cyanobacterium RU_3_3]NJR23157.1 hypothetical protein [Richelia sp. CSU_2_1]